MDRNGGLNTDNSICNSIGDDSMDNGIPFEDMGCLYGFSLFTTFLVNAGGMVFLLDRHAERLLASVKFFGFELDYGREELKSAITKYISQNCIENKIMRVTITRGNEIKHIKPSVFFTFRDNTYKPGDYSRGCRLMLSGIRKNESSSVIRHKTANYLENYLALEQAKQKGYDDCLFLNTKGLIAETSKSNLFFVKDGVIHTPSVECGLLPGIVRQWIIEKTKSLGVDCEEGDYNLEDLLTSEEAFLTNSVMGIMPVTGVDGCIISNCRPGEIARLLMQSYRQASE